MEVDLGVDNADREWSRDWHATNGPDSAARSAAPESQAATSARRKRAPVACRRCRRLRSKCVHEGANPPCALCKSAGDAEANSCVFIGRSKGERDRQLVASDREYRQRRRQFSENHDNNYTGLAKPTRVEVAVRSPNILSVSLESSVESSPELWNILPPFEEVIEGVRTFFTACFQLGFLPKAIFLERLSTDRESISVFFILSILSVSARFTKCFVERYGSVVKATDYFINRAAELIPNELYTPSLERCQSFFLLGVSEWTQGNRTRSSIHMGISVRMAGIQHLHREETYALPQDASTTDIINSEVARRTFWVLQSQDHLYSEHNAAVSFPLTDITALLPSAEQDFAYGCISEQRAALGGTQVGKEHPDLCSLQTRSPFATLIQAHSHWGDIARIAGRASRREREKADAKIKPWQRNSEYSHLTRGLKEWEDLVPSRHKWSLMNLRGHKAEFLDLAYLSQVMVVRINNIVIRRIYLEDILESKLGTSSSEYAMPEFWTTMSTELFTNVYTLHECFDTWFSLRAADEGIPSIVVFCVYICGSLASYLWKWPQLCPELASGAELIVKRSLVVLEALMDRLPHVKKWLNALEKISLPLQSSHSTGNHFTGSTSSHIASKSTLDNDSNYRGRGPVHRATSISNIVIMDHVSMNAQDADSRDTSNSHTHSGDNIFNFDPDFHLSTSLDSRHLDGISGIDSLDLNSGYRFDEELMKLLQEGI